MSCLLIPDITFVQYSFAKSVLHLELTGMLNEFCLSVTVRVWRCLIRFCRRVCLVIMTVGLNPVIN